MRILSDIGLFLLGLTVALFSISVARPAGPFALIQFPVIILVLAVFFLKENKLAALTAGMGIGMDVLSAYPFMTWFVILGGTTFVGWWISKNVLTNRSLPSLILLGTLMRLAYFILELAFSRLAEVFGGTVWYKIASVNVWGASEAFALEMLALIIFFFVHVRVRGDHARMLTHV